MKYRSLALTLTLALLTAPLAGCNGKSSSSETVSGKTDTSQTESQPASKKLKDSTLFIYMCGSNLETKKGLAGKNIDEILSADISEDLNIVIETGGALEWQSYGIDSSVLSRYEVVDGQLSLVETLDGASMGNESTLSDFLVWGQENYPSEHNMFIFWDHGAGPTEGVCFDEKYDYDSLTLPELSSAFENAGLSKKFDIIGFDACLMASIETAAIVKDYADFMIASEEIEPSGGWDYKALIEALGSDKESLEIGKKVCDSYMEKCKANGKELLSTLSVFDLSFTDDMLKQLEFTTHSLIEGRTGTSHFSSILAAMRKSEKFGGSNSYQGSSNLIDLVNFVANVTEYESTNATYVFITASQFIPYTVNGGTRKTRGVSFFYPLVYDRQAIADYISVGISEDYNSFLTRYFLNAPDTTIEYADKGSIADDGAFSVALTPESISYINSVDFILSHTDDYGTQHIVCTDSNIDKDWENLVFKSNFQGVDLALDGHRLFYSSLSDNGEYISFSSPVLVNGEHTNLLFTFVINEEYLNGGYYEILGTWDGYDENGLPDTDIKPLKQGDKIQVVTDVTMEKGLPKEHYGKEFTIGENGGEISEQPLEGKQYQYTYVMTDIFGYTFISDMATFEMTVSYDELLKDPLPDGSYAAKVIDISPNTIQYEAGSY